MCVCVCVCVQLLKALSGEANITECGFVKSDITEASYFATPLLLGKNGMEKNLGYGTLTDFEKKKLEEVYITNCTNIIGFVGGGGVRRICS